MFEPRGAPSRPGLGREWSDEFDDAVRGLGSGFLIGALVVVALVEETRRPEGDRATLQVTFATK